jgi:hypothetical protein
MKKSLLLATMIVAGAGALGATVGAVISVSLNGSDTLFNFTNDLITAADTTTVAPPFATGGADQGTITYLGGGSGTGQNAMQASTLTYTAGNQYVAPMSKFLTNGVCPLVSPTGTPTVPPTGGASGCIVGLDGIAVVASTANGGNSTCNGDVVVDNGTCSATTAPTYEPTVGAAYNTTICGQTFNGWRDVLSILYLGMVQNPNGTTTVDCTQALRLCIADNWGSFFENPGCQAAGTGDANGATCTRIQHAFRRDDGSGTTDVFGALLNVKVGLNASGGVLVNSNMPAANNTGTYYTGADGYCNNYGTLNGSQYSGTPAGHNPGGEVGGPSPNNINVKAGIYANSTTQAPEALVAPDPGMYNLSTVGLTAYLPNDAQDYDPIRRECSPISLHTAEQVCEGVTFDPTASVAGGCTDGKGVCAETHDCSALNGGCFTNTATLGLVLPIVTTNTLGGPGLTGSSAQYPTQACTSSANVAAPLIWSTTAALGNGALVQGCCPDGSTPKGGGCRVPVISATNPNPNCLDTGNIGAVTSDASLCGFPNSGKNSAPSGFGPSPAGADPRVYNLSLYTQDSGGTWRFALDDSNRPVMGDAFFRLHETKPLASSATACTFKDATDQIGCLVQASPCSIGYAGREAADATLHPGSSAMRLAGVASTVTCIQDSIYPLWRKLYLNSIVGFNNIPSTDPQYALAQVECDNNTYDNVALNAEGFIQLPSFVNNGQPYCENFNAAMLCGNTAETFNASGVSSDYTPCNGVQGAGFATGLQTTCGNGIKEAYEDCDNGPTTGGSTDTTCTNTCRFKQ